MSRRELTIVVLGQPGRTAEAVSRAVAAVQGTDVECDVLEAMTLGVGEPALSALLQRCADAVDGACETVLVRLRLGPEDAALMEELSVEAQQDLLVEPEVIATPAPVSEAPVPRMWAGGCPCGGIGCVQCMGEACP